MSENPESRNDDLLAWILLVTLSIVWGSSFILIKKSLLGFTAPMVGALRVIFASLFLLPFIFKNLKGLKKEEIKYLFFVGLTGSFVPAILFALAQTMINSSVAGLLNSLTPTMVLIVGALFFRQKVEKNSFVGVALGLVGSFILIAGFSFDQLSSINFYSFFVILATLMYGINLNLIKHKLLRVKSTQITVISICMVMPLALVFLLVFTPFTGLHWEGEIWWSLLSVAVLGMAGTGVALFLFNTMVKISSAVFSSSVTYLIPIFAIFWGIIDNETIKFQHIVGLTIIITGIILINRKKLKK